MAHFEQLHHTVSKDLYSEILNVGQDKVKELDTDTGAGADIDLSLWNDIEEESVDGEEIKGVHCIKTQKRRDLKMKKHRRAKRKKVMLLKLKASGKI
jgi:hypothetical protein